MKYQMNWNFFFAVLIAIAISLMAYDSLNVRGPSFEQMYVTRLEFTPRRDNNIYTLFLHNEVDGVDCFSYVDKDLYHVVFVGRKVIVQSTYSAILHLRTCQVIGTVQPEGKTKPALPDQLW